MSVLSVSGNSNSNVKRTVIKDYNGNEVGCITVTSSSKKSQKRLSYNYKRISSQILRAKTTGNVKKAAILARKEIAQLKRQQRTGEYDDREILNAIEHAQKMERIAKKKEKHLQEEDEEKSTSDEKERIRKKHRASENNELSDADMKYIKNRNNNVTGKHSLECSVVYSSGGVDIPVESVTHTETGIDVTT